MKIKGKILEMVKPGQHEDYITPNAFRNPESPLFNTYFVRITTTDIPLETFKSFFKRNLWKLKDKKNKGKPTYLVSMKECPYELGEEVEIEIERYYEPTDFYFLNNSQKTEEVNKNDTKEDVPQKSISETANEEEVNSLSSSTDSDKTEDSL